MLELLRRGIQKIAGPSSPIRRRCPGPLDERPKWGAGVLYFHHPIDGASAPTIVSPGSYANCIAYSRSDASNITLNAGNVSSWVDLTGNGRPFVQSSALRQPAYVNNGTGVNGLPFISFAGSTSNELRLTANGYSGVVPYAWMVFRPKWPGSGPGTSNWYFFGGNTSGTMAQLATPASSVNSSTLGITTLDNASVGDAAATINQAQGYTADMASDTGNALNGGLINNATTYGSSSSDASAFDSVPFNIGDTLTTTLSANFELYEIALYSSLTNLATIRSQNLAYAKSYYGSSI